ncbi:MAG: endonuclease/exonuclease/phosphatase family protein [Bacteroidota bacterium]
MPSDIIKIGNFNLYNLVGKGKKFYGRQYSEKHHKRKVDWISEQLQAMRADIIGFQEIFHAEPLKEAVQPIDRLRNGHYAFAKVDGRLPRVGLLSRYPIVKQDVYEDFPVQLNINNTEIPIKKFSRPVLRAELQIRPDLHFVVFVVHLKSKRPDLMENETRENHQHLAIGQARSLIRRAAEATALRALLLEDLQRKNTPVIVMGDVNDSGLAVTTRILSGEPPHRRFPQDVKEEIWDVLLYHARDIQARQSFHDFYYTHIHNGHHEALDHIMVSQELVGQNPDRVGRIGYVKVFTDHLVDETLSKDKILPWKSDHGQVVATVELD